MSAAGDNVTVPSGPGVIDHVLSWTEVVQLIGAEDYAHLGRVPEAIVGYRSFTKQLKEEYETVGDYVAAKVFEVHCVRNVATGKLQADWAKLAEPRLVWCQNDFPYSMEQGIEHHVLWSTGELSEQVILDYIAKERPGYETVWFINPPHLKSVKNIHHAHILSRQPHLSIV